MQHADLLIIALEMLAPVVSCWRHLPGHMGTQNFVFFFGGGGGALSSDASGQFVDPQDPSLGLDSVQNPG